MSKKEKLRAKIAKLQAELHAIEVKEWWEARPHIAEFECECQAEYNDEGSTTDYFKPYGVLLNHEWIKYNGDKWQTFCDAQDIPLEPTDSDEMSELTDYYMRDINDPDEYEYDYPNFVVNAGLTLRNPNYAS